MKRINLLITLVILLHTVDSLAQCNAVTGLTCAAQEVSSITVNWHPLPVNPTVGYHVQYKSEHESFYAVTASKFSDPWINEVRYKSGTGAPEGYEIVAPSGMQLDCYEIWPFQASQATPPSQNNIHQLSGTLSGSAANYYFSADWRNYGFQAAGGALALVYNGNDCNCPDTTSLIQYIQFGVNYATKPVIFNTSPTIVAPPTPLPANGEALAMTGTGDTPDDFSWQLTPIITDGSLNDSQVVASILTQSNESIKFERLAGCTSYGVRVRAISSCSPGTFGPWDTIPSCNTLNYIRPGDLNIPGGSGCSDITICQGEDPGFNCIANFNNHLGNTDPCIDVIYFITLDSLIHGFFNTPGDLNDSIPFLPEGLYEINAIAYTQSIAGYGYGNHIVNDVTSVGCLNWLNQTVPLNIYDTATIVNIVPTDPTTCNGMDGTITVTTNQGLGTLQYRLLGVTTGWQTSNMFDSLAAGTYTLQVNILEAPLCLVSTTVTLNDPPAPALTINSSGPICNGDSAFIDLSVSGTGPFAYVWNNGSSFQDITVLADPVPYRVTVTDISTFCSATADVLIEDPPFFYMQVSSLTNVSCHGESTGSSGVTAFGGIPPYSYLWSDGQTTSTATGLSAATYSCSITDSNGCEVSYSPIPINQPSIFVLDSISVDSFNCFGLCNVTLTVHVSGGVTNYNYAWADGNYFNPVRTNICKGVYTVSITDQNGCSLVDSVTVGENPEIEYELFTKDPSCTGYIDGQANVTVSGGSPPYSYVWLPLPYTTPSVSGLDDEVYGFNIIDSKGCNVESQFELFDPPVLQANIYGNSIVCENGSTLLVATIDSSRCKPTDPIYYDWGFSSSDSVYVSPPADNTVYSVTVTDCNGCIANSSTVVDVEEYPRTTINPAAISETVGDMEVFEIELDDYFDVDANYIWYAEYEAQLIDTVGKKTIDSTDNLLSDSFVYKASDLNIVRIVTYTVVAYTPDNDCEGDTLFIEIKLNPEGDAENAVTELITPNGDSRNDKFFVYFINEDYHDAKVKIFNRSGAQVFEGVVGNLEVENYWDGTYNNSGEPLPDGTYWYVVIDDRDGVIKKGAITMIGSGFK